MGIEKHKSSSEKKLKSSRGEKKRKRDNTEDGHILKSKKLRAEKTEDVSFSTEVPLDVSPFYVQTSSLYLPLAPISQKHPIEGMCAEHLSPLLLTYYPPVDGLILSYSNPRLSQKPFEDDGDSLLLKNIDEYAVSWAWVTADFLLLKPEKGTWLEGFVNLQNHGHLGVVCWNLFNASIERKRLPRDWEWRDVSEMQNAEDTGREETYAEEGIGFYVDGEGTKIEGMVKFRVAGFESSHDGERGFLTIVGTMLNKKDEMALVESEKHIEGNDHKRARKLFGGPYALGETKLGVVESEGVGDTRKMGRRY